MLRRYLVWPIVGVWLVAAFFVLRGRAVRDDAVAITRTVAEAGDSWWREDRYYDRENNARATLVQRPQSGEETYENPERIRVLLIGDSFTYGTGLRDMDRRLGSVLETMLDDATAEGTFEVVTVAYPGASTFTQASWLRKAREGARLSNLLLEQRIGNAAKLHGPFDALMVGYVENDILPDGRDVELDIPEDYHAEVRHTHGEAALLERYVDMYAYIKDHGGMVSDVLRDGSATPNDPYYPVAVRDIRSFVGDNPALVMPLLITEEFRAAVDRSMETFQEAGFTIVGEAASDSVREATPAEKLMVTAVDRHPGSVLLQAYATDMTKAVLDAVPRARIVEAERRAAKARLPLVSNHLPLELSIEERDDAAEVTFDGKFEIDDSCMPNGFPGFPQLSCEGGVPAMYGADGTEWTMQYVPCVPLGRTFAQIMFHKGDRGPIEVQLTRGEAMQIYSIKYTPAGEEVFFDLGTLETGNSVRLSRKNGNANDVSGIAVAPINATSGGGGGCGMQQPDPMRLPPFTMVIRAAHSTR